MPKTEPDVPRIEIKIRSEGEWLKFQIGNITFRAKEIGNRTYDLVSIEQFITKAATKAYSNIIQTEQIKKDLKSAIDWDKKHATNSKTNARVKDTLSPGE